VQNCIFLNLVACQKCQKKSIRDGDVKAVMGTHSFIRYFVTVTITSLVTAVTNEFLFSSACNKVTEVIGDLKND
jgi:hypothetical protein